MFTHNDLLIALIYFSLPTYKTPSHNFHLSMTTIYVCVEVFPSLILKSDNRISYTISWRGKTSVTMTCTSISLPFSFPSFTIFFLSINRDALSGLNTSTIRVLDKFNYKFDVDYDDDDIKVIQYATALVSFRAALLVSICTAVLLNRMNEKEITIAVDGSVYKHHPRLKTWMKQLIKEFAPEKEVSVFLHIPIGKFSIPWCYWLPPLSFSLHLLVRFDARWRWQWQRCSSCICYCSTH